MCLGFPVFDVNRPVVSAHHHEVLPPLVKHIAAIVLLGLLGYAIVRSKRPHWSWCRCTHASGSGWSSCQLAKAGGTHASVHLSHLAVPARRLLSLYPAIGTLRGYSRR